MSITNLCRRLAAGLAAAGMLVASMSVAVAADGQYTVCDGMIGGSLGSAGEPATSSSLPSVMSDLQSSPTFNVGSRSGVFGGETFIAAQGGYIDSAIVATQFRLRFDAAYNNPFPDRAEFLYGQCGCFGGNAPGPPLPERSVDYQDIRPYLEYAFNERFSAFLEAPIRFLNPEVNANTAGFSDLEAGFKYALRACPDDYITFQLKVYTPTGDGDRGLGTAHASIEPGFLMYRRLAHRLSMEGEVRYWIPISDSTFGGRDFAGDVLRYGLGFAYDLKHGVANCQPYRLSTVLEFVGWSVLDGQKFNAIQGVTDADTTIVNAKLGARYTQGRHSFYAGYGHRLTGQFWYEDIFRAEYRIAF